jgi:hypothetical protein
MCILSYILKRSSSVSIVSRLQNEQRGIDSGKGRKVVISLASRQVLGPTQFPIQWVPGVLFWGIKRPVREAIHSPPSNAKLMRVDIPLFHNMSSLRNA